MCISALAGNRDRAHLQFIVSYMPHVFPDADAYGFVETGAMSRKESSAFIHYPLITTAPVAAIGVSIPACSHDNDHND